MDVREFDDILFIFDSDTSALLRTRNPLLWQEKINGWTHELSMLTAGATNENLFDVAHPIVRMIAAGVKKLNERTNTNVGLRTCNVDRYFNLW